MPDLIKKNNILHSSNSISFKLLDIRFDEFPKADLLICRDLFIHFSYKDIKKSLRKMKFSLRDLND